MDKWVDYLVSAVKTWVIAPLLSFVIGLLIG
jgi:hypothetical protein